jgi:hypothetical protein
VLFDDSSIEVEMMKKDGFFTWEIFCLSRKAGALNARWEGTIWLARDVRTFLLSRTVRVSNVVSAHCTDHDWDNQNPLTPFRTLGMFRTTSIFEILEQP